MQTKIYTVKDGSGTRTFKKTKGLNNGKTGVKGNQYVFDTDIELVEITYKVKEKQ